MKEFFPIIGTNKPYLILICRWLGLALFAYKDIYYGSNIVAILTEGGE